MKKKMQDLSNAEEETMKMMKMRTTRTKMMKRRRIEIVGNEG